MHHCFKYREYQSKILMKFNTLQDLWDVEWWIIIPQKVCDNDKFIPELDISVTNNRKCMGDTQIKC